MGVKSKNTGISRLFTKKGDGLDKVFLAILLLILATGLCSLFTASYAVAASEGKSSFFYVQKQAIFMVAGFFGMMLISHIDYRIMSSKLIVFIVYTVAVVLIVVTLFMPRVHNVTRWIYIGSMQFQPTEIGKFAIILWYSYFLDKYYNEISTIKPFKHIFKRLSKNSKKDVFIKVLKDIWDFIKYVGGLFIVPLGIMVFLILRQPHLSCIVLIGTIALALLFIGGVSKGFFTLMVSTAAVAVGFISQTKYFKERMATYFDPFADPTGDGWQIIQSLYAIGSGGFSGVGLGESRQKYSYVPEPENDFIFSIICEEAGFIGALFVIMLFVLLVYRGIRISGNARDRFGALLAVGTTLQIGIQALLNIAVVSGTIPNTGISLPFFSSGGTSLIMLLLQVGVILSVSRTAAIKKF